MERACWTGIWRRWLSLKASSSPPAVSRLVECKRCAHWRTIPSASALVRAPGADQTFGGDSMIVRRSHVRGVVLAGVSAAFVVAGLHLFGAVTAATPLDQASMAVQASDFAFAAPDTVEA